MKAVWVGEVAKTFDIHPWTLSLWRTEDEEEPAFWRAGKFAHALATSPMEGCTDTPYGDTANGRMPR